MARPYPLCASIVSCLFLMPYDASAQESSPWRQAYRDMAQASPSEDSRKQLQIGLWCLEKGIFPEAFDHLDRALQQKGEMAVFRKALESGKEQSWISGVWKALAAASTPEGEIKSWMTHAYGKSPSRALICEMALDEANAQARSQACRLALQSPRIELRSYAIGKIYSWFPAQAAGSLLLERALCDLEVSVREKATLAFKPDRVQEANAAFLPFLNHNKPSARIHAAEALGNLGEPSAIPFLLASWKAAMPAAAAASDSGGPRTYASFGTQQAYVRDFDVQIATAATIAKPVIGILQSGSVIDVRILGVSEEIAMSLERRALHGALVQIAGRDFGNDPKLWQDWWSQRNAVTTPN